MNPPTILEQINEWTRAQRPWVSGTEFLIVHVFPDKPMRLRIDSTPGSDAQLYYVDNDPGKYSTHMAFTCWRTAASPQWHPLETPWKLDAMLQKLYADSRPPPLDDATVRQLKQIETREMIRLKKIETRERNRLQILKEAEDRQRRIDAHTERVRKMAETRARNELEYENLRRDKELKERNAGQPVSPLYDAKPKIVKPWTPSSVLLRQGFTSSVRYPRLGQTTEA